MSSNPSIENLFSFFEVIHDPRRQHPTTLHKLKSILVITLLASICGAKNWCEVELWAESKKDWLASFLDLPNGVPSHDTFGRVFALLHPESLHQAFLSWMSALSDVSGDVVALDGKTVRRSLNASDGRGAIHLVSAWAAQNELVLAQYKVDEKTNEIKALPQLIRMLDLRGSVVTIDAMGCQVEIAQAIIDQGADYVLRVKENQGTLFNDCQELFVWMDSDRAENEGIEFGLDVCVDGDHGRVETREMQSTEELDGLDSCRRWPQIRSVLRVRSTRQVDEETSTEDRYYISSLRGKTDEQAKHLNWVVRTHWEIENKVHWVLDVAMREDESRAREGHSAENLALIRKLTLNLLRREKSTKVGIDAKQKKAGWDHDYLLKVLAQGIA